MALTEYESGVARAEKRLAAMLGQVEETARAVRAAVAVAEAVVVATRTTATIPISLLSPFESCSRSSTSETWIAPAAQRSTSWCPSSERWRKGIR